MIEPTDSEIIMYVSILQTIKENVEDEELRDKIIQSLGELISKYSTMKRGDRMQMVRKFKDNVKEMQDLNSKEYTIDTREQDNG